MKLVAVVFDQTTISTTPRALGLPARVPSVEAAETFVLQLKRGERVVSRARDSRKRQISEGKTKGEAN